ncbi:protein of unknown function [Petrocella atlantisensis]|uniref:Uncharacterized protein n=1 Tax=Petrocella atlantisensis TaxID=2173034 RepID=A0A3P7RZB8_9FIRM|nr:protein of unknown function [Petrocella atlantisensis]
MISMGVKLFTVLLYIYMVYNVIIYIYGNYCQVIFYYMLI